MTLLSHSDVTLRPKVSLEVGGAHGGPHKGSRACCTPPHTSVPPLLQVPGCRSALRNGQSDCTAQATVERSLLVQSLEAATVCVPANPAHHCLSPRALHMARVSPKALWLHTEEGGGSFRTPSPSLYRQRLSATGLNYWLRISTTQWILRVSHKVK